MPAIPKRPPLRALVTRPRPEAGELTAALARRGIEAVIEPLLEIRLLGRPAPDFAGVQAVLCTSANGVRALATATVERAMRLFAVGDATAARARAEGFDEVESAGGDVGDLARLVRRRLKPADGRLLHVAGTAVAGDLAGDLGAAGFTIERTVLYEAQAATALTPATTAALADGGISLALFFSPRTAAIFARLAIAGGIANGLGTVIALSISPAADAALIRLNFRERAVASIPTQAALLDRVDALIDRVDALIETAAP
ncbi:MAG TPA: uroporphyrinogen-III synthase [Stellaceae bacterium]|jgi:uroporphyrinogen-III synthase|nr:uroporphyrinogen-III synthase [Stellaceae bacterium]